MVLNSPDVIIVEDDPYYFLQQTPYVPKDQRTDEDAFSSTSTEEKFIAQLAPSFLKYVSLTLRKYPYLISVFKI